MIRHVLLIVFAVVLWAVFGYYWSIVVQDPPTPQMKVSLITLGVLCTFIILFLVGWILHNIRMYRDKERRGVPGEGREPPTRGVSERWVVEENSEKLRAANYTEPGVEKKVAAGKIHEEKPRLSGKQV